MSKPTHTMEWISVEDQLPPCGLPVLGLVVDGQDEMRVIEYNPFTTDGDRARLPWDDDEGSHPLGFITHWMPLPNPPEKR